MDNIHNGIAKNDDTNTKKIRNLLLYRNNIKKDSTSSKILEMLYDEDISNSHDGSISELSLSVISKIIRKPYKLTKNIVLELKYSGYLESNQKGRYTITQRGKWFVICQKLDGISFLSLCLLAETYHRVKSNPEFFYPLSVFREYYEKDYAENHNNQNFCPTTAIYHRTNISKSLKNLTSRNLIYVVSGDFIKIRIPMIEFLKRYDVELYSLFVWCSDIYENCTEYLIENNDFGFDISRIFPKRPN